MQEIREESSSGLTPVLELLLQEEREACAKIAEAKVVPLAYTSASYPEDAAGNEVAKEIAKEIRARK